MYWLAPTNILTVFSIAVGLAIGHHCFYAHLSGRIAPTGDYTFGKSKMSKQQVNIAVGTAFAFFFKAALAWAVASSYTQVFWRVLKTSSKVTRLGDVDAAFSLPRDLLAFCRVSTWRRQYLVLVPIATIFWLIPIASIFTPATLAVRSALVRPPRVISTAVPQLYWTNQNFFSADNIGNSYPSSEPSAATQRIIAATVAQGRILPIQAPGLNASWPLQFWGTAIHCWNVSDVDRTSILNNYGNALQMRTWFPLEYFSWERRLDDILPFDKAKETDRSLGASRRDTSFLSEGNEPTTTTYIAYEAGNSMSASFYYMQPITYNDTVRSLGGWPSILRNTTILGCSLYNSSYTIAFNYRNGEQQVPVLRPNKSSDVPIREESTYVLPQGPNQTWNCSSGDPDSYGYHGGELCFTETNGKKITYQAINNGFRSYLTGEFIGGSLDSTFSGRQAIRRTILIDTDELRFLHGSRESELDDSPYFVGRSSTQVELRGPLIDTLEQLFENVAISMLSDPYLQPNYSSPSAPSPMAEVTFREWRNVYHYDSTTLWISYGITSFFAAFAILVGLLAMLSEGAAYDSGFSTIPRASKLRDPASIDRNDAHSPGDGGSMPLPTNLVDAIVVTAQTRRSKDVEVGTVESEVAAEKRSDHDLGPETLPLMIMKQRDTL